MPVQQKQKSPPTDEEVPPKNKEKASPNRASAKPQQVKHEGSSLALVRKPQYSNPTATPEKGAMRDPFGTYPMAISDVDYQLIQHCELTTDFFLTKLTSLSRRDLSFYDVQVHRVASE
jgi:hypothetical protein